MSQKTSDIIFGLVIIILIGVIGYLVVDKRSESANNQPVVGNNTNNMGPTNSLSPTTDATLPLAQSQVYHNQYIKVTIPAGWSAQQAVNNPAALNITKGNYILFINARANQASGVEGGRFEEYAGGAPSVDALIVEHSGGPCGKSETSTINANEVSTERKDYYVSSNDSGQFCRKPTINSILWYLSVVGNGFNYFNVPDYSGAVGWVATMAYNSKVINSFPVKNSSELNQILSEMTSVIKTLTIKAPVAYIPEITQNIKNINNTYWSSSFSEGANSSIVSCTDTVDTSNISQNKVQTSYHMESLGIDDKTVYASADQITMRIQSIENILEGDGWIKCNTVTKQSAPNSKNNVIFTDAMDVYQKGKELTNIDNNSFNNVYGGTNYNIFLTFFKLK
jgi:hypothetical protein